MTTSAEAVKPRLIDRVLGPSPREVALERQVAEIEQTFARFALKHENLLIDEASGEPISMHEALSNIDLMIDAKGWTNIFEYDDDRGLTLRQIKEASVQLRELVVGNPFIGNGSRIRSAQTMGAGCEFSRRNRRGKQGVKPLTEVVQDIIESPWGQRYVFGNKAMAELERAVFTDGIVFILGRDSDKRLQRIQLHEITGAMRNPNNSEEVWAYRRAWNPSREDGQAEGDPTQERVRWYYTDMVPAEERRRQVRLRGGTTELAEIGYTLLDMGFNRQVGWSFGVPDALCVVAWARLYKEFLVNGYVMSRSLARLAYKITVGSAKGGDNAAATVATPGQGGSAYIQGSGNELTPLATAGKGYDFASGGGLGSAIAAGLGVSWLALSANPAQGATNAAASTLDPVAKATAAVRRKEWEDEFVRLFRFLGMQGKLVVTWYDLPEDTLARLMQAWTLVDQTELFSGEVLFREIANVMNIGNPGELRPGWKPKSERGGQNQSTFGQTGTSPADGRGSDDGSGDSPDDHDDGDNTNTN